MKSIYKLLMVAATAATLTSCLKDKNVDDQVYGMTRHDQGKIVELPAPPNHNLTYSLDLINADTVFNVIAVGLAADQVAQEDITVTLTLDNSTALIDEFNNANSTSLEPLDPNIYTLLQPGLTVTIPKGQRFGYVQIRLNPTDLDPAVTSALGFRISSVTQSGYTISGNFGHVIASIGVKNKYDGRYDVTGTVVDANGVYQGYYPKQVDLVTVNSNTVDYVDVAYDYPYFLIQNISTGGLAYLYLPRFVFDTNTDKLIQIRWADDNTLLAGHAIDTPNQFVITGTDKTFDIKYRVGTRWTVTEHFEYTGPRP